MMNKVKKNIFTVLMKNKKPVVTVYVFHRQKPLRLMLLLDFPLQMTKLLHCDMCLFHTNKEVQSKIKSSCFFKHKKTE